MNVVVPQSFLKTKPEGKARGRFSKVNINFATTKSAVNRPRPLHSLAWRMHDIACDFEVLSYLKRRARSIVIAHHTGCQYV